MKIPRLAKIQAYSKKHPYMTGIIYMLIAAALLPLLIAVGILPNASSSPSPQPIQTSTIKHQQHSQNHSQPPVDWQNSVSHHAKTTQENMQALLNTKTGINNLSIREYLQPQASDPHSDYTQKELVLTDLVKKSAIRQPTTPEEANRDCTTLDEAYSAWEKSVWDACSTTLHDQVAQMTYSAHYMRSWLREQQTPSQACVDWSNFNPEEPVPDTTQGRAWFTKQTERVKKFNDLQLTCSQTMPSQQLQNAPQPAVPPMQENKHE